MLCEHTEYVWNDLVYCGKMNPPSDLGHAETVVLKLIKKLLDRGHALHVDNFYTSVPLAEALLNRKTLMCVILRKNRKHLRKNIVSTKLKKGQHIAKRKGRFVVEKWEVLMLSSFRKNGSEQQTNKKREEEK